MLRPTPPTDDELSGRQRIIILGSIALGMMIGALDQNAVGPALATVSAPIYGKLGDLFGRKSLFQIAIGLFLLGSVVCATAGSMTSLISYRSLEPFGIAALVVTSLVLSTRRPNRDHPPRLDYADAALLSSSVAAVVLATSWGGSAHAWDSPAIVLLFVAAEIGLFAFAAVERRASDPLVPMRMFRS